VVDWRGEAFKRNVAGLEEERKDVKASPLACTRNFVCGGLQKFRLWTKSPPPPPEVSNL
jgi:hypothetical protein